MNRQGQPNFRARREMFCAHKSDCEERHSFVRFLSNRIREVRSVSTMWSRLSRIKILCPCRVRFNRFKPSLCQWVTGEGASVGPATYFGGNAWVPAGRITWNQRQYKQKLAAQIQNCRFDCPVTSRCVCLCRSSAGGADRHGNPEGVSSLHISFPSSNGTKWQGSPAL